MLVLITPASTMCELDLKIYVEIVTSILPCSPRDS